MVGYFVYLISCGAYERVEWSFPIAGHTKFGPDMMFGWLSPYIKQFNLYEVADIVTLGNAPNTPSHYSVHPSMPGDFLNWKDFTTKHVKPVKDMKRYHHFVCCKKEGVVTLQGKHHAATESWTTLPVYHTAFSFDSFPSPVPLCPLKVKKIKDLISLQKYCDTKHLSYAHPT